MDARSTTQAAKRLELYLVAGPERTTAPAWKGLRSQRRLERCGVSRESE
jgi:hypothetical protein